MTTTEPDDIREVVLDYLATKFANETALRHLAMVRGRPLTRWALWRWRFHNWLRRPINRRRYRKFLKLMKAEREQTRGRLDLGVIRAKEELGIPLSPEQRLLSAIGGDEED